jgi:hypothetical protein
MPRTYHEAVIPAKAGIAHFNKKPAMVAGF